ncbi:MAG: arginase family protein [Desulfovibrionaceae bacterium]|nr:arginase family protein [Desulfovibrionaceae bacterium]
MQHLNLIFPQWQGNTEDSPLRGALEFMGFYLNGLSMRLAAVGDNPDLVKEAGIIGRAEIVSQLRDCIRLLEESNPDTIFTLGGGCDAGLPAAAWLNAKYQGDLCLVWFDAHADLNTPETSPSGMFCGMPLRALTGEGDAEICAMLPRLFRPEQLILAGVRTTDKAEADFIETNSIPVISCEELAKGPESLLEAVAAKGFSNVCIHVDLDVVDPSLFPNTRFPEPGGITPEILLAQVEALCNQFKVKGAGIFEYAPSETGGMPWLADLVALASRLGWEKVRL